MSGRPIVFCSHASADKSQVLAFASRLRADGFDAWVDGMEIGGGDDLVDKINDGLSRATAGLIFFSRHIDQALWARSEINYLTHQAVQGLRVIPVMIDEDAPVPPLLAAYLRRPIEDYEAIRNDLLDHRDRASLGMVPDRSRVELLVQLTALDEGVRTRAWLSGTEIADATTRLPPLLDSSYTPAQTDIALTAVGRECGTLLFPEGAASRVQALLTGHQPGDQLDIVVEAGPELLRLPFETACLPVGGTPLLIAMDGVTLARRPLNPPARLTPALAPPLKILAAVAAPDEETTASSVLDGERELARILDAQPDAAQVRPLEVAGLSDITAALKRDEYHVLHLSGHGSADGIELEDEDGRAVLVTPEELASAIHDAGRPLPLLFLSCCDPRTGAGTTRGLAERLLDVGLSQIIAMNGDVTDIYATALAARFYQELADAPDREPATALAHARRSLERERQRAAERGGGERPEYSAATMFCAGVPQPVVVPGEPRPLHARIPVGSAGPVPFLGVDDLVGRRAEVRTAVRTLAGTGYRGVTLSGMGGLGKSTVAGRVIQRMVDRSWAVATVAGVLDLAALCSAVREALDAVDNERARLLVGQLGDESADDQLRMGRLTRSLREHRLLIVLDNFEDNLTTGGEKFNETTTENLIKILTKSASVGRILITSRYPLPSFPDLLDLRLAPLSNAQTGKLLLRLPGLNELTRKKSQAIFRLTGGHPRLLELVDAALRGDTTRLSSMTERLNAYAAEHSIDLTRPREDLTEAISDAITIELRDIALDDLFAELTENERDVLLQAAVSTIPISLAMLTQILSDNVDPVLAAQRLVRFSLLTAIGENYFVERWTAEGLRSLTATEDWRKRLRAAAASRLKPQHTGLIEVEDAMEGVRNLIEATDFDKASDEAVSVCDFLRTHGRLITVSSFAGECLTHLPITSLSGRLIAEAEAEANVAIGLTTAAEARWLTITKLLSERTLNEPDNTADHRELSVSYNKLGDLMAALGRSGEAHDLFQQSLNIRRRLATKHPDIDEYQRDLSVSYNKLGDLMAALGRSSEAHDLFQQSLNIRRQLATKHPNFDYIQRDLSVSYDRLGDHMFELGRNEDALRYHQQGLEIAEQLVISHPLRGDYQRDLSISYNKLGDLMIRMDRLEDSLHHHERSLGIALQLTTLEPQRSDYQRDLVIIFDRLGSLMVRLNRAEDALRYCQRSVDIALQLTALEPHRADYQRDLAISYEHVGDIMGDLDRGQDALYYHQKSLEISEKLASSEPDRADYQRSLANSYERLAESESNEGNLENARTQIRKALEIRNLQYGQEPDRVDMTENLASTLCQAIMLTQQIEPMHSAIIKLLRPLAENGKITKKGVSVLLILQQLTQGAGA
ncbi:CHAT domain-containing protein [Amycolatopsis sp. NPDC049159]|uniref:CHAT domain-containing protein n=1 Tax=Amycolatopsis sp. NPDC049159 TaxID=3157210 RepID=UPI0033C5800F